MLVTIHVQYFYVCSMYPNQNTPGVKKVAAKNLKKAMLKKCDWACKNQPCEHKLQLVIFL